MRSKWPVSCKDLPIDTPMNASSVWFKLVTSNMKEKIQGDLSYVFINRIRVNYFSFQYILILFNLTLLSKNSVKTLPLSRKNEQPMLVGYVFSLQYLQSLHPIKS